MNIKKLIVLIITTFSFPTISWAAEAASEYQQQEELALTELEQQQIIASCQLIQKECSKQINFLSAILQQIIGSIQKGTIKTPLEKKELIQKITVYLKYTHMLQGMGVQTADPAILFKATIILKNLIDRLTIAVNSGLTILDLPAAEHLMTPDKNFEPSFEYLEKMLKKNQDRLEELEKNSTNLGLTIVNKAVRMCEDFVITNKWPLVTVGLIGAGCLAWQAYNSDNVASTLQSSIKAFKEAPAYKDYFTPAALAVGLTGALFHKKLGEVGSILIDNAYIWTARKYKKGRVTLTDFYDSLKGIKNIKRDGLSTSLENHITLEDESLIGLEDQKIELYKILAYLRDPELYIRSDNEIAKCILFIGPSRTGKTALAKAMGATIDELYKQMGNSNKVEFIEANDLIISKFTTLPELINYAINKAPCILFIDEMHLLGLQKTADKAMLNDFLTQLTELHKIKDPKKQVFIIGATNHPELLAPELFKHERFGKVIRFKKPGIRERTHFFMSTFDKYGINPKTIDVLSLVLQTKDCDYGHLQQIIKDARFEARAHGEGVGQEHLQRAVNRIVHGINATTELTPEEAKIIAIDQAGKIVVHRKLDINETIHLVTINKVDGKIEEDHFWLSEKADTEVIPMRYGTIVSTSNREEVPYSDSQEVEKLCKRSLAGIAAQKILLGTYYIDYTAQDYKTAFELAQKLVLKGLTLKSLPQEQQNRVFLETQKLVEHYEVEVQALLAEHTDLIEKLVTELLKERCITSKEIDNIVQ